MMPFTDQSWGDFRGGRRASEARRFLARALFRSFCPVVALMSLPVQAAGEFAGMPSGLAVTFHEAITNQPGQGLTYRFRFIAPDIARAKGQVDFDLIEADMAHLCKIYALPRVPITGPVPNRIVISIADRVTKFGAADAEATQFFEAYSIDGDSCVWEPF